jgi:hypothetical protein
VRVEECDDGSDALGALLDMGHAARLLEDAPFRTGNLLGCDERRRFVVAARDHQSGRCYTVEAIHDGPILERCDDMEFGRSIHGR